mmetsp:Transcript_17780/g.47324  ORF Transcript_17780/g.47324 Transcript_17780/m.47324 type:complete len:230 (-) Transcript_17780:3477-4166(-)
MHHLDVPLAEPVQVGSNTHTAACRVRQSERLLVRPARLTGDEAASLQALDAHAPLRGGQACPDDSIQYMPCLPVDTDRMRLHGLGGQLLHVGVWDVQVFEALQEVIAVHPLDLYDRLQLFHTADPCPRVASNVHPRDAFLPGELRGLMKDIRFLHTEGARFDRHVIADQDNLPALRILWSPQGALPHHHAHPVVTQLFLLDELTCLQHELPRHNQLHWDLVARLHPKLG